MRISVVIPTHDRAALVTRAVTCALSQERPPDEVVVVDDGSTDGTAELLADFGPELRYVRQEHEGAAAARNRGVQEATGDWIAFLDSDDVWLPDHLRAVEAALEGTSGEASLYFRDVTWSSGDRAGEDREGRHLWDLAGFSIEEPYRLERRGADWVLLPYQPMMLQASTVRRATYLALGGLRPDLFLRHDTYLFYVLGFREPLCAVNGVGTRMTADAGTGRLTALRPSDAQEYWHETLVLYGDLLASDGRDLTARQRRLLRSRVAEAHWRLSRLAWSDGDRRRFRSELLASLRSEPAFVAGRVRTAPAFLRRRAARVDEDS
ncbi:MAG: glycosyltransferase family 2 protein [Acidimicrobiia bacterium]|nr:glycosyltransferase family 2 protein [Acidimicrobiia bacterium]